MGVTDMSRKVMKNISNFKTTNDKEKKNENFKNVDLEALPLNIVFPD